jgi:hypothetical protein
MRIVEAIISLVYFHCDPHHAVYVKLPPAFANLVPCHYPLTSTPTRIEKAKKAEEEAAAPRAWRR